MPRTLLDILSGGQYQTSKDLPPLTSGNIMEDISSLNAFLNPPLPENVEAPGLGPLEYVGMSPLASTKSFRSILKNFLKSKEPLNVRRTSNTPWGYELEFSGRKRPKEFKWESSPRRVAGERMKKPAKSVRAYLDAKPGTEYGKFSESEGYVHVKLDYELPYEQVKYTDPGIRSTIDNRYDPVEDILFETPFSSLRFYYNPSLKKITNVDLGAGPYKRDAALTRLERDPISFPGKQTVSRMVDDFFKALPKGTQIDPHPINENSLQMIMRGVEKNKDKLRVNLEKHFSKSSWSTDTQTINFTNSKSAEDFVNRYKDVLNGLELGTKSKLPSLYQTHGETIKTSQLVHIPTFTIEKIK